MVNNINCNCTGCSACMVSCPQNAITMVSDEKGFKYPKIELSRCVNCDLCIEVCPMEKIRPQSMVKGVYAVQHKDLNVLKESTSGGMFTAISDYILKKGGIIYGAMFDEDMLVRHMRVDSHEQRNRMRGSKYVQSDLKDIFKDIKKDLVDGKIVLFVGTPCQIDGLKNFLSVQYDRLVCLDLICHGVPSPLIFKEHLSFLSSKYNTKIMDYKFRSKKWGWHKHIEIIYGENKDYFLTPYTDLWKSLYYSRVIMRPSCNQCRYSNLNRCGDITIGDCRGIDKITQKYDSYNGVTLTIINTVKGSEIFEELKENLEICSVNIEDLLQPPLIKSGGENSYSEDFFRNYIEKGYEYAVKKYYGKLYVAKYYVKKIIGRN